MKTAEFGKPATHLPQPGTCRICGCGELTPCNLGMSDAPADWVSCGWTDGTRTLCDNPECVAEAKRELGIFAEGETRA